MLLAECNLYTTEESEVAEVRGKGRVVKRLSTERCCPGGKKDGGASF